MTLSVLYCFPLRVIHNLKIPKLQLMSFNPNLPLSFLQCKTHDSQTVLNSRLFLESLQFLFEVPDSNYSQYLSCLVYSRLAGRADERFRPAVFISGQGLENHSCPRVSCHLRTNIVSAIICSLGSLRQ